MMATSNIEMRSQETDLDNDPTKLQQSSKKRRISQSTEESEAESNKIRLLRKHAILKKQEQQAKEISLRETELREYLFLQSGSNIVDYNPLSSELLSALESYHTTHRLTSVPAKVDSVLTKSVANGNVPKIVESVKQNKVGTPSGLATRAEPSKEDIASKASKDAEILKRVSELQKEGFWSTKRISKLTEPQRNKVHWDFLLAEMAWLANDFKEERKFKTALAKKVSRQVAKHFEGIHSKEKREAKEEEVNIRKKAKQIATQVKRFWNQIEKLAQYKQQLKADEEKKKELDKQLDLLVGQTEKYSEMLAQDLAASAKSEATNETPNESNHNNNHETTTVTEQISIKTLLENNMEAEMEEDQDFAPQEEPPTDDETTIAQEEKENSELQKSEITNETKTLEAESNLPLEEILKDYQLNENDVEDEVLEEEEEESEDMDAAENESQDSKEKINEAAIAARAAQPTGFTLSTTKVKTKVPFLLRGTLREYQHIGLDWLVTMYDKNLNGILADEMGLGKTVMTISLLAHLACEKELWGPHLIVVPTSLMLNWELELKRWCPGFKVLTYYGSPKERRAKRQGWTKPNSFHVCITSYKLVIQDQAAFRRKQWDYLILDEAQHIKNFKSQRWQVLLNFNSKHRLLLTGTPLQNNLMELWSLMHFLMPHIFESHKEFKDWFSNPVTSMIEGEQDVNEDLINRLHGVLRPFLLRRLKSEVEKQLPQKHHHVVKCKLSKRQRFLYEEFMSSSSTRTTLASGNFLGIMNALMQLRKVCNHPDLFEVRPIVSPFDQDPIVYETSSLVSSALEYEAFSFVSLPLQSLLFVANENYSSIEATAIAGLLPSDQQFSNLLATEISAFKNFQNHNRQTNPHSLNSSSVSRKQQLLESQIANIAHQCYVNKLRNSLHVIYGRLLRNRVTITKPSDIHQVASIPGNYFDYCNSLKDLILTPAHWAQRLSPLLENFICIIPKARSHSIQLHCCHPSPSARTQQQLLEAEMLTAVSPLIDIYRLPFIRQQLYFPDKRLIQYDCGKLQELAVLLRTLKAGGHRGLIFTQMTKVLDILEIFLNIHGYTYLRLDGATRVEKRQMLMERFNRDNKIFLFILSTRSGGIGINLTGADTVIFYDSDWNPAMDAQAQDRCHRIGQTREVHIYRLISEHTVEENILKKSNQKKYLDDLVITGGSFTPDFFKKLDLRELIEGVSSTGVAQKKSLQVSEQDWVKAVSTFEDETDTTALKTAQAEQDNHLEDFNEESVVLEEMGQDKEGIEDDAEMEQEQPAEDLFEGRLTAIQRYALRYLENASSPATEVAKESENGTVTGNEEMDQDDVLFYEIPEEEKEEVKELLKAQALAYAESQLFFPPNPDMEELYLPPIEDMEYWTVFSDYLAAQPVPQPSLFPPIKTQVPEDVKVKKKGRTGRKRKETYEIKMTPEIESVPSPSLPASGDPEFLPEDVKSRREKKRRPLRDRDTLKHKRRDQDMSDDFISSDIRSEDLENEIDEPVSSSRKKKKDKREKKEKKEKKSKKDKKSKHKDSKSQDKDHKHSKKKSKSASVDSDRSLEIPPWTAEEDLTILNNRNRFGNNWDFVTDMVNSIPRSVKKKRNKKQCFERWKTVLQSSEEAKSSAFTPNPFVKVIPVPSTSGVPQFTLLELIKKTMQKKKQIPGRYGNVLQTDAPVAAHSSHAQAAVNAGLSPNLKSPRTPIEILALKMQRAKEQQQIVQGASSLKSIEAKLSAFGPNAANIPAHLKTSSGSFLPVSSHPPFTTGSHLRTSTGPPVPAKVTTAAQPGPTIPSTQTTHVAIPNPTGNLISTSQPELSSKNTAFVAQMKDGSATSMILNANASGQTSRLAHINQVVASGVNVLPTQPRIPVPSSTTTPVPYVSNSASSQTPNSSSSMKTRSKKATKTEIPSATTVPTNLRVVSSPTQVPNLPTSSVRSPLGGHQPVPTVQFSQNPIGKASQPPQSQPNPSQPTPLSALLALYSSIAQPSSTTGQKDAEQKPDKKPS